MTHSVLVIFLLAFFLALVVVISVLDGFFLAVLLAFVVVLSAFIPAALLVYVVVLHVVVAVLSALVEFFLVVLLAFVVVLSAFFLAVLIAFPGTPNRVKTWSTRNEATVSASLLGSPHISGHLVI